MTGRAGLDVGLVTIGDAPKDSGIVDLIVRRPASDEREVLDVGRLDPEHGLVGDDWSTRGSRSTLDGSADPAAQLTVMSSRVAALIAGPKDRWALAGDQVYVDLDLSEENLPAGTRLRIGAATIEITAKPHTGCQKFTQRFGLAALQWTKTDVGRSLRLRGVYARVIGAGDVRVGDAVNKG